VPALTQQLTPAAHTDKPSACYSHRYKYY